MKLWRTERGTKYIEGVAARTEENSRIRKFKEVQAEQVVIPSELLISFPDPVACGWQQTLLGKGGNNDESKKDNSGTNRDDEMERKRPSLF